MGVTFRPMTQAEREKLGTALRRNASDGAALLTDPRDTSFVGSSTDELRSLVTDEDVIAAIKSVPTHY